MDTTDTSVTKTIPAEIKKGHDRLRYCWPAAWPRQKVKLCHIAQFTRLYITYREVADDKVIAANMR